MQNEVKNNGIPMWMVAQNEVTQEEDKGVRVTVEDFEKFHRASQKAEQLESQVEMCQKQLRTLKATVDAIISMRH